MGRVTGRRSQPGEVQGGGRQVHRDCGAGGEKTNQFQEERERGRKERERWGVSWGRYKEGGQ